MIRTIFILSITIFGAPVIFANSHHPEQLLQAVKGKPNEGQAIYQAYCMNCHAEKPIINLGAPRIGDKQAWEIRLKKGLDKLFSNIDEGINAMPQRGGCFECTDKQLMLAVAEMLSETQRKTFLKSLERSKKYH